jgi:hypothetical protein
MISRAHTKEEVREHFLYYIKSLEKYWLELPNKTVEERMDGLIFSILVTFDGESIEFPAMDIVLSPHPSDRQYHIDKGDNWHENGMAINDDVCLHEEWVRL